MRFFFLLFTAAVNSFSRSLTLASIFELKKIRLKPQIIIFHFLFLLNLFPKRCLTKAYNLNAFWWNNKVLFNNNTCILLTLKKANIQNIQQYSIIPWHMALFCVYSRKQSLQPYRGKEKKKGEINKRVKKPVETVHRNRGVRKKKIKFHVLFLTMLAHFYTTQPQLASAFLF